MSPIGELRTGVAAEAKEALQQRKLRESAVEFEGLLLSQLLRQAREAGNPEENSNDPMREFAEEQLARVLAQGGTLGMANFAEQATGDQPMKARGE